MKPEMPQCIVVLLICAAVSGCILNDVQRITAAPRHGPDAAHAYVVIGIGAEETYPYPDFQVTLSEFSVEKQRMTGNCFRFNRIQVTRPAAVAPIQYFAFEVPANAYAFGDGFDVKLAPSSPGRALVAPPGGIIYFGDYVYVGHRVIEFRRDLEAARAGTRSLMSLRSALALAETTAAPPGAVIPLCTP